MRINLTNGGGSAVKRGLPSLPAQREGRDGAGVLEAGATGHGAAGASGLTAIGDGAEGHAARSANVSGNGTPFPCDNSRKAGSRQRGTRLFIDQPETVLIGNSSALATATMPPKAVRCSFTVMPLCYAFRNINARGNRHSRYDLRYSLGVAGHIIRYTYVDR